MYLWWWTQFNPSQDRSPAPTQANGFVMLVLCRFSPSKGPWAWTHLCFPHPPRPQLLLSPRPHRPAVSRQPLPGLAVLSRAGLMYG